MKTRNWYKGLTATAITLAMTGAAFTVPALAIEYDLSNGDVYVDGTQSWQTDGENEFYYGYDASTDSWTNKTAGRYDHVANNDNQVDISHPSDEYNTGSVTVSGDASDLEISINAGDVGTTDTFLTVEEGTEANITVDSSLINAGDGENPAMEINGGNVTFTGENVVTGSQSAIEIGGDATVTVDAEGSLTVIGDNQEGTSVGTGISVTDDSTLNVDGKLEAIGSSSYGVDENAGTGVGVSVTDNGQVNVSGDLVAIGNSVSISDTGPMAMSNGTSETDNESEYDYTASGIGIDLSGNGSLTIEEDGTLLAVGSDVTVQLADSFKNPAEISTSGSYGVKLNDNSTFETMGDSQLYGSQMYVEMGNSTLNTDGNAGLSVSDDAQAVVSDEGSLYTVDAAVGKASGSVYVEDNEGSYFYYNGYKSLSSYRYTRDSNGRYTKSSTGEYVKCGNEYVPIESIIRYSSQSNKAATSGTEGVGVELDGNGQLNVSGGTVISEGSSAVELNDQSQLNISGGKVAAFGNNKEAIHLSNEAGVIITSDGYLFTSDDGMGGIVQNDREDTGHSLIDVSEANSGNHFAYYNGEDDKTYVYWDIAADATGNQVVDIAGTVLNAHMAKYGFNAVELPGDAESYVFEVVNHSNHTYGYLDGSFDVSGYQDPDNPEWKGSRLPNEALLALYGKTDELDLSFDDLLNVVDYLLENGYNGHTYTLGEDGDENAVLVQFYLDYINEQTGRNYTSLKEVSNSNLFKYIFDSEYNGIYTISKEKYDNLSEEEKQWIYIFRTNDDGSLSVQIKEQYEPLSALGYFYSYCLAMAFGEDAFEQVNTSTLNQSGKDYDSFYFTSQYFKDNPYNLYWDDVNQYFADLIGNRFTGKDGQTLVFNYAWGLDGPKTDNNFQNYSFAWNSSITLDQLDGILDLSKVDEEGNVITSDEATFQIWYDENGTRYYLTLGEDGLYKFVTDESTVDTINGHLLIEYALLEGVNYNIKEVTAPDGYLLDDTTQVLILKNSEDPFVLSVTNAAEEDDDDEEEEGDTPEIPEYPELPDYDPPEVDIDDPDVPLVENPDEPEEPTEEIDDEETPLTPSIPDEEIDEIIAEIEDEVTPLTSVPQTGTDEMSAATAALPAGVLAAAVAAMVRRIRRKG